MVPAENENIHFFLNLDTTINRNVSRSDCSSEQVIIDNPSNTEAMFVLSTRGQRSLKAI